MGQDSIYACSAVSPPPSVYLAWPVYTSQILYSGGYELEEAFLLVDVEWVEGQPPDCLRASGGSSSGSPVIWEWEAFISQHVVPQPSHHLLPGPAFSV